MPEDTCAPRIASLSEQAKALERRASELAAQQDDDEQPERLSAGDLDALRSDLHAMLNDSDPKRVKRPQARQGCTPSHDRRNPRGCTRSDRPDLSRTGGRWRAYCRLTERVGKTSQVRTDPKFEDARGLNFRRRATSSGACSRSQPTCTGRPGPRSRLDSSGRYLRARPYLSVVRFRESSRLRSLNLGEAAARELFTTFAGHALLSTCPLGMRSARHQPLWPDGIRHTRPFAAQLGST